MRTRVWSTWTALVVAGCGGLAASDYPDECGDGWVGPGEECDRGDGNDDQGECTTLCRVAVCGDGLVAYNEACDDENDDFSDGCHECSLGQYDTWSILVYGVEAIAASGGRVYVAGYLQGTSGPTPIAILDRDDGSATWGDPWDDLIPPGPERGPLSVAPRSGGAVVAGHATRNGSTRSVSVTGWYDNDGDLVYRYEVGTPGNDVEIADVAVGPSGLVGVVGTNGALSQVLVLDDGEYVWDADVPGASTLTSVDAGDDSRFALGGADGDDGPVVVLDQAGATNYLWIRALPPGDDVVIADVRFVGSEVYAAVTWDDGAAHAILQPFSTTGSAGGEVELDLPDGLELDGVRILSDGRALSFGRRDGRGWLALHDEGGVQTWRANPDYIASVRAVESVDGEWVFAVDGDVVRAWRVE